MGGDFTYQDASMWYKNLDKLIKHTNAKAAKEDLKIKLFYSTPSCYLKAVHDANVTFPTKRDDFFPYASDSTAYWTGYFTSRPTTKFFERLGNNYLQGIKQLQVIANLDKKNQKVIDQLSDAMGVMQHHDAITGTEKQHVTHDYERILSKAIDNGLDVTRQAFRKMAHNPEKSAPVLSYHRCQLNQSECHVTETSERFIVTLYNPLGWAVEREVKLPVVEATYRVYAPNGDEILSQMAPLPQAVLNIPTRESKATHELVFIAKRVRPLGIKQFFVVRETKRAMRNERSEPKKRKLDYNADINDYWKQLKQYNYLTIQENQQYKTTNAIPIRESGMENNYGDKEFNNLEENFNMLKDKEQSDFKNEFVELERLIKSDMKSNAGKERVAFDNWNTDELRMLADEPRVVEAHNDFLEDERYRIYVDESGIVVNDVLDDFTYTINVGYYEGCVGNNGNPANRSSGAYIFRPKGSKILEHVLSNEKYDGPVFKRFEAIYVFGSVQLSLYDTNHAVHYNEISWTISIDVADKVGKEFFIIYKFNNITAEEFYTDSNGRQMLARKRNSRPQYDVKLAEPIPGNYYPVTNEISITDKKFSVKVLTDRAQGGSALEKDEIELMIHRRLLHDDAFGVAEALNETAKGKPLVVTGSHIITVNSEGKDTVEDKKFLLERHLNPQIFLSDAQGLEVGAFLEIENRFWGLQDNLTRGIHLLTLERWTDDSLLIRLENYLESYMEDSTIVVDASNLFNNIKLKTFRETNLSANKWLDEVDPFNWNSDFNDDLVRTEQVVDHKITLNPKQIRTFVVTYEYIDN